MRTKLLRKLRKHFNWHYDHDEHRWYITHKKTNQIYIRHESWVAVSVMANEIKYFSIISSIKYFERKQEVAKRNEYHASKKKNVAQNFVKSKR